jgi:hypothetical protein
VILDSCDARSFEEIIRPVGGERQLKFVILFDTGSMRLPRKNGNIFAAAAPPSSWNKRGVPRQQGAGG